VRRYIVRVSVPTERNGSQEGDGSSAGEATPLEFPENTYLIDVSRALVYIPIPKVACTSLKTWFLQTAPDVGIQPDPTSWKVNAWLGAEGRRYLLDDAAPLSDGRNFQFTFVRNPWSRLVSAFLNRIVGRGVEYRNLMTRFSRTSWYRFHKRLPYELRRRITGVGWSERSEVTFRQFVLREVAVNAPMEMDPHWRPQHTFLGAHRLDFVGRFERLTEDLEILSAKLGIQGDLPERNRSTYVERRSGECFADCAQSDLRALPAMPHYTQFYTPDRVAEVARVYATDIERFGYDF
jgi:hypothetical protein